MRKVVAISLAMSVILVACGGGDQADQIATTSGGLPGNETTSTFGTTEDSVFVAPPGDPSEPRQLEVTLKEIPVDGAPTGITIDGGTAWAVSGDTGALLSVDLVAGSQESSYAIGNDPVAVALAEGSLWVTEDQFGADIVRRFNPQTGELLAEIASPPGGTHPLHVAGGAGTVWVTVSGAEIAPVDLASNEMGSLVGETQTTHPAGYGDVVFGFGSVWFIDSESGRVERLDPATGAIIATFDDLGYAEEDLGTGSTSILARGPAKLAVTAEGLWVLSDTVNPTDANVTGYGALFLIDPGSEQVVRQIDLRYEPDESIIPGLVITDDAAWFVEFNNGNIVRVDLSSAFEDYVYIGIAWPVGLVATADTLWYTGSAALIGIDLAEAARLAQR